ncbi:MAG: Hint domain-containing protein [Candidatus Caenarcaniphilales bacterium]|nr:Hint domain-containing protein [Candidatus Caenarcaniphilales bacterium]
MFSGGTSFQGGELKDVSGTVGLWSGSKTINPVDWTCFVAGTPVTLADGSFRAIETLKKGDKVLSWNEKTNKNEERTVLNAFQKETKQIVELKLQNGKFIEATPDHPFYVQNKGWVEAGKLNTNDKLFDEQHLELSISSITIVDRSVPVYNLEIEDTHTYYAHGVLVHNVNCWVRTKDGEKKLVTDKEYAQLIKDGKDPEFLGTESGKPTANNPDNPINQAFQAAQNGKTVDFNYTPEQFVEFVQSEDGFKAQQNSQYMKNLIADHFKVLIIGTAAGIVFSQVVGAFKGVINGNTANEIILSNKNLKHISRHLPEFQELDSTFTIDDLVNLGKQVASNPKNLVNTQGGNRAFDQTVKIGNQQVTVRSVLNSQNGLRTVHIRR